MSERTGDQGYPPDEFDDIRHSSGRRGAHRARANPALSVVPVVLVVVVVVAAVVGAMSLLGDGELDVSVPVATGPATPGGDPDGETATDGPATDGATQEPTDEPTEQPTDEPTETEEPEPEPTVDTSVTVVVLNGTTTSGLAAGASQRLTEEGWSVPVTDNYRSGPTPPTTVYYPSEDLEATAEAIARDVGGAATELSDAFGDDRLTVVLGEDYDA